MISSSVLVECSRKLWIGLETELKCLGIPVAGKHKEIASKISELDERWAIN